MCERINRFRHVADGVVKRGRAIGKGVDDFGGAVEAVEDVSSVVVAGVGGLGDIAHGVIKSRPAIAESVDHGGLAVEIVEQISRPPAKGIDLFGDAAVGVKDGRR